MLPNLSPRTHASSQELVDQAVESVTNAIIEDPSFMTAINILTERVSGISDSYMTDIDERTLWSVAPATEREAVERLQYEKFWDTHGRIFSSILNKVVHDLTKEPFPTGDGGAVQY